MRSRAAFSVVLLLSVGVACGASPRVAVADFAVSSENPRLKFVGKGLAEMIAAELVLAKDIVLIDRDKRAELLSEQEFALSEAAETEAQVQIGRILSADFLLYGEIVDMNQKILVMIKMVSVETGQVTWTDKRLGALSDYDLISSQFARSALDSLGAGKDASAAAQPVAAKIEVANKEEALIAFSRAVDSYDRKDTAEARNQLNTARRIDPTNSAVKLYSRKLGGGSPRFRVELDKYAPSYNPASLGLIEKGAVYYWTSMNNPLEMIGSSTRYRVGDYSFFELGATVRLGALLPVGERFGVSTEISLSAVESDIRSSLGTDVVINFPGEHLLFFNQAVGANLGLGWAIAEGLSVGIGARIAAVGPWSWIIGQESAIDDTSSAFSLLEASGFYPAVDGGIVYKSPQGTFGADLHAVWSNQADPYIDPATRVLIKGSVPLILAGSVTGGFLDRTLFANLRGIADVYIDSRSGWALRAIPSLEWWPFEWLALRAAYEYSQLSVIGSFANGHGMMAGTTAVLGNWEITLNYVYRFRPYRLLLGQGNIDTTFLLGVSWNGITRRTKPASAARQQDSGAVHLAQMDARAPRGRLKLPARSSTVSGRDAPR